MYKLFLIPLAFIFLPLASYAQLSIGGGLVVYHTQINKFNTTRVGIQARGMYQINKRWRPSIDYIFYIDDRIRIRRYMEFNANAHFLFLKKDKIDIYGLGGLNIFRLGLKDSLKKITHSRFGFNVGGGINFNLSESLSGIGEIRYVISDFNHTTFSLGILHRF